MFSEFQVRPMPKDEADITRRTHWYSQKRGRNLSITDEGWQLLGELAKHVGNRSEVIEVMARYIWAADTDLSKKRDKLLRDQKEKEAADKVEQVLEEIQTAGVERTAQGNEVGSADHLEEDDLRMQGVDLSACNLDMGAASSDTPAECSIS